MLVDRLRTLVQTGEHEQARELARAAVRNDDLQDVDISADAVTVTTTHFTGTHSIQTDKTTIASRGTYSVRADDFTLEFHTSKLPPQVETRVTTELANSNTDTDTPLSPDAAPATNGGQSLTEDETSTSSTESTDSDSETPEPSSASLTSRLSSVITTLKQQFQR